MRRVALCGVLLLAACKAHTPPDTALTARLRTSVEATCVAMALSEAERPSGRTLDDQVGLLAMRLSAEQVRKIDGGSLDQPAIIQGYRDALARRAERESRSEPPRLLVFLVERQTMWSTEQALLAAALLAQYEHEARLAPPPPALRK